MNKKYKRLWIFASILLSLFISSAIFSYAEDTEPGIVEIFDGKAELLLEEGYEFSDPSEEGAYYVIVPLSGNENWWIGLYYDYIGHVEETNDVDNKQILKYYNDYTGKKEFFYEPAYDGDVNKLSWCVRITDDDESYLMYEELYFIREGCLNVIVYCTANDVASGLIKYIQSAITITEGNTYEDFDPLTDITCDFDFAFWYFGESWSSDGITATYNFDVIDTVLGYVSTIFIWALIFIIFVFRIRKVRKTKEPQRKQKSINEKTPFRLRKPQDLSYKAGDSRSYYQKLRDEEERNAFKYADKDD